MSWIEVTLAILIAIVSALVMEIIKLIIDDKAKQNRRITNLPLAQPKSVNFDNAQDVDAPIKRDINKKSRTPPSVGHTTFSHLFVTFIGGFCGVMAVVPLLSQMAIDMESGWYEALIGYSAVTSVIAGSVAAFWVDRKTTMDIGAPLWQRGILAGLVGVVAGWIGLIGTCIGLIVGLLLLTLWIDQDNSNRR